MSTILNESPGTPIIGHSNPDFYSYSLTRQSYINNLKAIEAVEMYGTEGVLKVLRALEEIVLLCVEAFRDGLQITDLLYLPKAIGKLVKIGSNIPMAIKEIGDLNSEETMEVLSQLIAMLMSILEPEKEKE